MIPWSDFTLHLPCHWDKSRKCDNNMCCTVCEHQPPDDEKENGLKPPVELVDPYTCPSCGEPPYDDERCIFCGQRFLPRKEPEPDLPMLEGASRVGDRIICDHCGADLTGLEGAQFVSHFDGKEIYGYTFSCKTCGGMVRLIHKRKEGWL